jgi:hypothetical protein
MSSYCTAQRAALLAVLATVSMMALIMIAEFPLSGHLQAAVALAKSGAKLPAGCEKAQLSNVEGQLESFDGRSSGYGSQDALNILCAMEMKAGAGREAYLHRHFWLDMVFPALYGPAFAVMWLFLLRTYKWPRKLEYFAILPLLVSLFDVAENLTVRSIVQAGPPGDPYWVHIASLLTTTKYALVDVSFVPILAILMWYLITHSLRRAASWE